MKKLSVFLTLAMLMCLLAACGSASSSNASSSAPASSKPVASSQSAAESTQTDVLYAVFYSDDVKEYPITYTGAQKTAEELAHELSELTGLDFTITASKADDGLIVDWAADSTLVAGLDNREQKEEFFFFDVDSLSWFMMDSLWRTLTENLDAENIYYTMDGGRELVLEKISSINEFPSDIPYMGSGFYSAHADVRGDVGDVYLRTAGLWRLDGEADTASIEMDGLGGFVMYYASGSVEASGYLESIDEYGDGNYRYDCYSAEGKLIVSFYLDSNTQLHIGNEDGLVYLRDTRTDYQGFWAYPDGTVLEISDEGWNLYTYKADELTVSASGPVKYDEGAAYLMNDDGSSGGGKVNFDEEGNLIDSGGDVLTFLGLYFSDVPKG